MKTMKFYVMVFALSVFSTLAYAQDDYGFYLQKARQRLAEGDCEGAQRNYNVYKELSGSRNYSLEENIKECEKPVPELHKSYGVGDDAKDFIGYNGFKIAYIDASGKHGFAIKEDGESTTTDTYNAPSLDELRIIYSNRYSLGLSGEYWSKTDANSLNRRYTIDFSTGETHQRKWGSYSKYKNIRIKRF